MNDFRHNCSTCGCEVKLAAGHLSRQHDDPDGNACAGSGGRVDSMRRPPNGRRLGSPAADHRLAKNRKPQKRPLKLALRDGRGNLHDKGRDIISRAYARAGLPSLGRKRR